MGKTNRMDAQTGTRVLGWPSQGITPANDDIEERVSWFRQRLIDLGVIEMATSTKPPGFYVNFSTVTVIVLVVSAIGGLWWFTWQTAYQQGFQKAQYDAQIEQLQKESADAKKKAEDALKLQTYNARQTDNKDGHTKTEEGH